MCGMCQGITAREAIGQVRDTILRHGWATEYVESDGSRENPSFAYTVWLSRWDHPEFICFRMCPEYAGRFLNRLGTAVPAGRRFDEGDDLGDVSQGDDPGELLRSPTRRPTCIWRTSSTARGRPPGTGAAVVLPEHAPLTAGW
jgi:hypothetical protein